MKGIRNFDSIAICNIAPTKECIWYGDVRFSVNLQKTFIQMGYKCQIYYLKNWDDIAKNQIVIHLRGSVRYYPNKNNFNVLWIISSPEEVTIEEVNEYDIVLCSSKMYTVSLKKDGFDNIYFVPQATEKDYFSINKESDKEFDLLFIGNNNNHGEGKPIRKVINDILKINKDYNLKIIGRYWEQYVDKKYILKEFIHPDLLPTYYCKAKININDHRDEMRQNGFINNRTYDIAALGQFQISDYVDTMDELMIESYTSLEMLEEKIDFFLHNKHERKIITEINKEKISKFTFENIVSDIIKIINRSVL